MKYFCKEFTVFADFIKQKKDFCFKKKLGSWFYKWGEKGR